MKRLTELEQRVLPYFLVAVAFGSFTVIFMSYHTQLGTGIASLATVPVVVAGWYFGIGGGIIIAASSIAVSGLLLSSSGQSAAVLMADPGNFLRSVSLLLVAVVTGRLSAITSERAEAILRLERYEKERRAHTSFLELLNRITRTALESEELETTLRILVDQIAVLFEANDCFFARWDEANALTVPMMAYGSFRDTYPHMRFEPGEKTLTSSILEAGSPLAIAEIKNSPYISPRFASRFISQSMLGLPLIAQNRKLGSLILGYNESRSFDPIEISRAEIAAEQIALVLLKSQVLEEAQRQVVELTTLHDVALASIQADNEDQLIERATEIIGKNLFPDNFGVLLLDGNDGILRAHPSYRFISSKELRIMDVPLGRGISGQVAETGRPLRIGNVDQVENYIKMDKRISSELCVPMKIKDRVLGVINAESVKKDAFTVDDERLLTTLAGQLATAIEQMRKAQTERKWLDQLAHSNNLIYALAHVTTHIEKALTRDQIIETLGTELDKINLACAVAVYDEAKETFTIRSTSMKPDLLELVESQIGFPLINHVFQRDRSDSGSAMENLSDPVILSTPEHDMKMVLGGGLSKGASEILQALSFNPNVQIVRLPLVFEEHLLGIIWLWGGEGIKMDLPILSIFAKQIGTSLERARLFQEVQSLALTDPLTGLHNRRSLFELGKIEIARARRFQRPFCCLMLDLDHFKQINDTHGHRTGDLVLQEFAKRCRNSVREIDLVGRYGGEEMVILMPETELDTGIKVAERLRTTISEKPFTVADLTLQVSASIGVSTKDDNTPTLDTLIARADQAMYIAKHKGRNRVAVSR